MTHEEIMKSWGSIRNRLYRIRLKLDEEDELLREIDAKLREIEDEIEKYRKDDI